MSGNQLKVCVKYCGNVIWGGVNGDMHQEISKAIQEEAKYYGAKSILLQGIDKIDGHPSVKGMAEICKQVLAELVE